MKKLEMNEKRVAVVEVLKSASEAMTLAEISAVLGQEVKSGSTNAMVAAGVLKKVGTKKVPKTVYVEVATYAIGDTSALDASDKQ